MLNVTALLSTLPDDACEHTGIYLGVFAGVLAVASELVGLSSCESSGICHFLFTQLKNRHGIVDGCANRRDPEAQAEEGP